MPKERRVPPLSFDQSRSSPYPRGSKNLEQYKTENHLQSVGDEKEWEETRCPICMEHPHNAVLLLCSCHEKGCRPYMCDTSYRHSNCLDQFCKSSATNPSTDLAVEVPLSGADYHRGSQEQRQYSPRNRSSATTLSTDLTLELPVSGAGHHVGSEEQHSPRNRRRLQPKLLCPLCRGQISGWIVMKPARRFMNSKPRNCSLETCDFRGTYSELRKHARLEHPSVRPSEADPRRQRDWLRLEHERDFQDILGSSQLESEEHWSDWMTLERDFEDIFGEFQSGLEGEWNSTFGMDTGLELSYAFLDSTPLDGISSGSSEVTGQPHNNEPGDEWDSTVRMHTELELTSTFLETSVPFNSLYETSVSGSSGVGDHRSPNRITPSGRPGVSGQSCNGRKPRMRVINYQG